MRKLLLALVLVLPITLVSCGPKATTTTPAPPNSPQTQVLSINNSLSDAIRLAVTTSISLRDQKVISPADTKAVQDWSLSVLDVKDQINKELASGDTWEIQKLKIVGFLVGFKLPISTSNPTLQAILSSVETIVLQLRGGLQ